MNPSVLAINDELWGRERARLVRFCAALTHRADVAEELAQETLLEAWRHRDRLREADGLTPWLTAIARNVYRRWCRAQSHESTVTVDVGTIALEDIEDATPASNVTELINRAEQARFLIQALDTIPGPARQALTEHIMLDMPLAPIAARLGLTESAMKVQVHRAKNRLRRELTTTWRHEAEEYGWLDGQRARWWDTPLWCPLCGDRHLQGYWHPEDGTLILRCENCFPDTGVYCSYKDIPQIFGNVTGLKAAFSRVMRWVNVFYGAAMQHGQIPCGNCGQTALLRHTLAPDVIPTQRTTRGLHIACPRCGVAASMRLSNLALYHPEAWRFWATHPRVRLLPEELVHWENQEALAICYQSVRDDRRLDILVDRASYRFLAIHQSPGSYRVSTDCS